MAIKQVDILGDEKILKRFKAIANLADTSEIENALLRVAKHVAGDARRRMDSQVRPKTGRLRRSIMAGKFTKRIKAFPGAWVMADRKIAPHSHLIEFGHATVSGGHAPAFPFLRPALDGAHTTLRASVKKAVPDAIRRAIRKG